MLTINKGKKTEVAVRVFLASEQFGTEFFDGYDSVRECTVAITRLIRSALKEMQEDGIGRQVGVCIIPPSEYDSMEDDEFSDDLD